MSDIYSIPIVKTPYVSELAKDYLLGDEIGGLNPGVPSIDRLVLKASERKFSHEKRSLLVNALLQQYKNDGIEVGEDSQVRKNILSLNEPDTFSFTTGQQIHIFLGPLFFLYKIQALIGHVKNFNNAGKGFKAVPVFWMATEDHDLAEINHIKLYGETYTWEVEAGNAVGRISCKGLPEMIDKVEARADKTPENKIMFSLFRRHYLTEKTLSSATRSLLHEIFEEEGLIIIDPDDKVLKDSFLEVAKKEIEEKIVYNSVKEKNGDLKKSGYEPRVNPQEVNFFWLDEGKRIKLRMKDGSIVKDHSSEELTLNEIIETPEKLSPNVLLRPVYQEAVLPNILYLGGSAEVEYWLPLQVSFNKLGLQYPVLMQRDSILILSKKNLNIIENAGFNWYQLFNSEKELATLFFEKANKSSDKVAGVISNIQNNLTELKTDFEKNETTSPLIFKEINELSKGMVKLSKIISDEELRTQKENTLFSRVLKIKAKFFDTKQEREEFVVNYPFVISNKIDKTDNLEASLILEEGI